MRVLVTGASGQLGYDVCRELERRGVPFAGTSSRTLDITDSGAVLTALETLRGLHGGGPGGRGAGAGLCGQ